MINFEKVRWKNLLSSGNNFTEVELDSHNTTLILGENGAGKSTLLDALCFGLYGRGFRNLKKELLINAVDFLCDTTGLVSLNARNIQLRPLDNNRVKLESQKWTLINLVLPIALILLIGLFYFIYRTKKYKGRL